ncbi:MAG: ribosome maturation factor RimM [Bacteroidota bacterium]
MAHEDDLLAVGRIVKAFGIRGEIVVQPMTDSLERFRQLESVLMGKDPGSVRVLEIEEVAVSHRGVRLRIAGITDRTGAEHVVGNFLFVDREHRVRIPRGRFFVHELIGMTVLDEEGQSRGVVRDVLKLPAHDVYVVEHENGEFMIPAVKEFIREISIEQRVLKVNLIDGLTGD